MKLTLGFSPCPNDTFIFDALVNSALEHQGIEFEVMLEDVQTLNAWAAEGKLDVTKLSFPALFDNADQYAILESGAALGKGVGPLLISRQGVPVQDIEACSIAIPGENTTAAFLLSYAFPRALHTKPVLFSSIEDAVVRGDTDLGVIIHENRFTYQERGLVKVMDLGTHWEERTGAPIPLGCIAVKRSLPEEVRKTINRLIGASLRHSQAQYPLISQYVKEHAQAMQEGVMRQHIELYVNDYTIALGEDGRKAIGDLYEAYRSRKGLGKDGTDDASVLFN